MERKTPKWSLSSGFTRSFFNMKNNLPTFDRVSLTAMSPSKSKEGLLLSANAHENEKKNIHIQNEKQQVDHRVVPGFRTDRPRTAEKEEEVENKILEESGRCR